MKKWIVTIFLLCIGGLYFFWKQGFHISDAPVKEVENVIISPVFAPESVREGATPLGIEKQEVIIVEKVLQEAPFISQAPTGNWKDLIFQNACEEATLLMAEKWLAGKKFGTPKETEAEIKNLTKEEEKYFPKDSYDLSVTDILLLAQKYFPEMHISLVEDVTTDDMKNALSEGDIVIVPANGQKLKNPNFTAPGPLYHTILVRGYDPVANEFIVNDPGTRRGNGYRYASATLFDAMQNYETGYHGKLFPDEKVMLIIRRAD
ncbi:MAG: C39 family peptidase [Candidatus Moraniibacteriota bacterium]